MEGGDEWHGVRCSAELCGANSRSKCNMDFAREGRSGTLTTNLPARRDRHHEVSPDHPCGEVYVVSAVKTSAEAVVDGCRGHDGTAPEHDLARAQAKQCDVRRRISPEQGAGTDERTSFTLPAEQSFHRWQLEADRIPASRAPKPGADQRASST